MAEEKRVEEDLILTEQPRKFARDWKHELLDCSDSLTDCLLAFSLPHCYAGCVAYEIGETCTNSILNCLCFPFCLYRLRTNVRNDQDIEGDEFTDFMAAVFCSCCTAIQINREFEVKNPMTRPLSPISDLSPDPISIASQRSTSTTIDASDQQASSASNLPANNIFITTTTTSTVNANQRMQSARTLSNNSQLRHIQPTIISTTPV